MMTNQEYADTLATQYEHHIQAVKRTMEVVCEVVEGATVEEVATKYNLAPEYVRRAVEVLG